MNTNYDPKKDEKDENKLSRPHTVDLEWEVPYIYLTMSTVLHSDRARNVEFQ